jgi:triphosphoribosyl-dephospho-CoA synthase
MTLPAAEQTCRRRTSVWHTAHDRHSPSAAAAVEQIAHSAVMALIDEALLTPKPALVDLRGSGAHHDLDLPRLLRSAQALRPAFEQMALSASCRPASSELREELGRIGRNAEAAMLVATGGSNSHRGAIWVLGLLVAGYAMTGKGSQPADVTEAAAKLARLPDRFAPTVASNGSRVSDRYGVGGARGEACTSFPHVIDIGLPTLWQARQRGVAERYARLDALIAIMASLSDTCLLHRGGTDALEAARAGAGEVMRVGGTSTAAGWKCLLALDAQLVERWVSPGGSADLLAACLFLDGAMSVTPSPAQ